MKYAIKTPKNYLAGILVLLATLVLTPTLTSAGSFPGNKFLLNTPSEELVLSLLTYYSIDDEVTIPQLNVKIFNKNDELIYSDKVCKSLFECDERLNQLLNQSDFITEIDGTKIYILNQ